MLNEVVINDRLLSIKSIFCRRSRVEGPTSRGEGSRVIFLFSFFSNITNCRNSPSRPQKTTHFTPQGKI